MNRTTYCKASLFLWTVITLLMLSGIFFVKPAMASNHPLLYLFWGDGCPHCEKEREFLKRLQIKYPELEMRWFETWEHPKMNELADAMRKVYGLKNTSVPMTFIGNWGLTGFLGEEETGTQIEEQIVACIQDGCFDPIAKLGPRVIATTILDQVRSKTPVGWELFPATAPPRQLPAASGQPQASKTPAQQSSASSPPRAKKFSFTIKLPGLGPRSLSLDPNQLGLPLFTVIIGLLDGLNPCAIWVLSFLLTLAVYAKSRSKILMIGGIFVIASGVIYFLFMAAWLNMFLLIGFVKILRITVALIAMVVGLINCKDFFFFKQGISLTIPESAQPKLFKKMRGIVQTSTLPATILGTIALAVTANLVELLCTAGFPAMYTQVLTLQHMPTWRYYLYLAFYNVMYVVPLAVIVSIFAWKMGGRKLTENEGRILKLIGGGLMLGLGIILLVKPELLTFR